MTWLYIPPPYSIASDYAPESVDSNLASDLASAFADMMCAGSVTWRGKLQQRQAWSRRWMLGGFIRLLSGATLPLSTADRGATEFISSLPVIRAKETASRASSSAPTIRDSSSRTSCELWMKCGLIVSSEKTSRGTRRSSSTPSSGHWSEWVTSLRREFSARAKPATPSAESESSLWPIARVARGGYTRDPGHSKKERPTLEGLASNWATPKAITGGANSQREARGAGGPDLQEQAQNWAAPRASDPEKAGPNMRGSKGDLPLPAQAVNWAAPTVMMTGERTSLETFARRRSALKAKHGDRTGNGAGMDLGMQAKLWPAPAARDYKGTNSPEHVTTNSTGSMHLDQLPNFVAYCLPPSFPDPPTPDGEMSSTAGHNLPPPSPKRRLNPFFVEALMRWPAGLSGFVRAETAWTQWWALQRPYVSALCSASTSAPEQGQLL